jgi:hypothetical protein
MLAFPTSRTTDNSIEMVSNLLYRRTLSHYTFELLRQHISTELLDSRCAV